MSVLILLNSLTFGGTERKGVLLANQFAGRSSAVNLAYLQEPRVLLSQLDSRVPTTCLHRTGKFSLTALRNLREFIVKHEVSVVLCMGEYPLLYVALLKFLRAPYSLKVILAINTTEFPRRRDRWFMRIYALLILRIEAVIYGCEYQRKLLQRNYGLRGARSVIIYNGVDTEYFDPSNAGELLRKELGIEDDIVIGCVGRLYPAKNHSLLLEAAAKLNRSVGGISIILVGGGPERERLEAQSIDLGIEKKVHFLGSLDDVRKALRAMDVFVLPSVETFSNAALEAMAMSLPVVLCDVGGASEMISDGHNGFLFQRDDVSGLVNLLSKLIQDPQLRTRVGENSRATVLKQFNILRMVDDYEALLSEFRILSVSGDSCDSS